MLRKIHCWQNCLKKILQKVLWVKRKKTPDSKAKPRKERKSTGNSKYMGKYKRLVKNCFFSLLNFFK